MKSKIFNLCITLLAVIGIICIIGSAGTSDYMTEIGSDCSLLSTIKTFGLGVILLLPAIIREVY